MCHKVIIVSESVTEKEFEAVMGMSFRYTRKTVSEYRMQHNSEYVGKDRILKTALNDFHHALGGDFLDSSLIRQLAPVPLKVANGVISAALIEGDAAWASENYPQTVLHLDIILTAFHNLCLQLIDTIES